MKKRLVLLGVLAAVVIGGVVMIAGEGPHVAAEVTHTGDPRLLETVTQLRAEHSLVGLAALVTVDGEPIASAVDGQRQRKSGVALELRDRFHLGSITKSFTATMIARLIEQQKIDWTTSVGEILGDDIEMHPDWKAVTIEQLLTHISGAPANFSIGVRLQTPPEGDERVAARKSAVADILAEEPESQPGSQFAYSNVGYTVAAVIAETVTDKSWEDLIRQEVFEPLEITAAGFGPPKSEKGELEQPVGHRKLLFFKLAMGEDADNTPIMGPAGSLHMTLADLCTYANEHRLGEQGAARLLSEESYERLHTPKLDDYACGWVVKTKSPWTGGPVIWHNGSNTMWYALVAILPEQNAVIAVAANDGDIKGAESAAIELVKRASALLEKE